MNQLASMETILEEAQRIVYGDREQLYDDPNRNFVRIAALWNAYGESRKDGPLTPADVGWMMVLVKMAREMNVETRDNRVDAAGYIACVDRIATAAK